MAPRLIRRLGSYRLAAVLITVLMGMTLINVIVPQRSLLPADQFGVFARELPALARLARAIGLDAIFGGWLIAGVSALLLVNVLACTWVRLAARSRVPRAAVGRDARGFAVQGDGEQDVLQRARAHLEGLKWSVREGDESLVAIRCAHGFWGSMLLHAGLAVVILGGGLSALGGFSGDMLLVEGQQLRDEPGSYLRVSKTPRIGDAYTGSYVSVEGVDVRYADDVVISAVARMSALDPGGTAFTRSVSVNHPLDLSGKSYLLQSNGYAVTLSVIGEDQQPGAPAVVSLAQSVPGGWSDSAVFESASGPLTLELTATPAPTADATIDAPQKLSPRDPRLYLRAARGTQHLGSFELSTGDRVTLSDGTTVVFEELRMWTKFAVRGQPFRWVVYVGFWMCALGALWRFGSPEQRVSVVVRPSPQGVDVSIGVRARPWMPAGPRAGAAVADELQRVLASDVESERER